MRHMYVVRRQVSRVAIRSGGGGDGDPVSGGISRYCMPELDMWGSGRERHEEGEGSRRERKTGGLVEAWGGAVQNTLY